MRVDKSLFTSLYIDNEQALYKYGNRLIIILEMSFISLER